MGRAAALCYFCLSAHPSLFFHSPGIFPGWEEPGVQDLRHAAVAGNAGCLPPLPWCIHGARLGGGVLAKGCPLPPPSCTFQVWSLLPGFCTHPTDVLGAFKGLARTLGMAISERPDLRPTVCQALRTLIHRGCETGRGLCWGTGGSCALQRPAEGRGGG